MTANRFRAWFTLSLTLTVMGWAMLGAAPAARGAEPAGIPGVSITKRADRVSVHRGEVLTYTVEVINGSGRDLRWGGGQGLVFEDAPPAGFSYVPRSGRITLPDGTSHPTLAPGARRGRLIFGLADAAGTLSGPDLAAGARIALTYQLAVGPEATVDRAVDNRVFARTLAGAAVTPEARARVRVEADAELDEALVLGVVFCDADEDGVQDPGEGGAGGVKIYGDHGWDVDTDAQGRWHLKGFRAGNHLVKVDEATLPPGGHLTTPPRRLLYLTPGLVTRTSFGTTCPGAAQRPGAPTRQAPAPAALPRDGQPAPARPTDAVVPPTGPLPVVTVAGDLAAGVVSVDGRPLPPMAATLTLQPAVRPLEPAVRPGVRNIAWSPAGLTDPAVFATKVVGRLTPATRWRLMLYRVSGSARVLVREMFGKGAPPASITWNGTDPSGAVSLVERGGLYHAVLSVTDGRGGSVQSAPAVFGVSYGAPERPLARRVIRGAKLFRAGMRPGPGLARALKQLKTLVRHNPGAKLIIDVHEGGAGLPEDELTRSRRGAFLLGELATKLLGLRPRAIAATGYGGTRPLRPVAGPRDADFNRRVELALYPAESPRLFKAPPKVERAPEVWVQGRRLTVDASGAFAGAVPRPREEALGITVRTRDGGQRSVLVATDAAPTAAPAPPLAVAAPVPAAAVSPPTPGTTGKAAANATAKAATGAAEAPQGPGPVGLNIGPTPRLTLVRVGAGGDEHKGPGAGDEAEAQGWTPAADDPLRRFGGRALREAIGAKSILLGPAPPRGRRAGEATAAELSVSLPPHGVKISTTRLWVAGTTNPKNKIQANGRSLHVNRDGSFGGLVPLPVGKSDLVVTSTDEAGYVARLAWPVEVTKSELFLMALADGALGHVGANLDERATTDTYRTGDIFLAGRGALTLKARVSGTELAKNLFITAHLDTAQREAFSAFYDQVIDPARDYAVFGDAAQDGVHAKMRGPLYVLVQADKSKLEVGNVHTDLQGVELFRYDRAFYGAQLDFNKAFAKGWDTRVQGFVTDDVKRLSRGHDELRATGGSLYYLSRRDVAEGSEKLSLVVREVSTGLELARRPLVRDRDYRVDYVDGRVSMKTPLPSTVDAMWSVGGLQPFRERELLDGHEVWLVADYEARGTTTGGDLAWGVHGSQRIAGVVEVGGGYVREGRADGGDDYQLLGAHVKVDLAKRTHAVFEYAESLRPDGVSRLSDDGGLRFRTLDRSGRDDHGIALKVGLSSHLGELFHVADDLDLTLKGYYQVAEPGFHAVGTLQDQGMERFGGQAVYNPTHKDRVALRADGALVLQPDERFSTGFRGLTRTRFAGQYVHTEERWSVSGEALFGQHRDDLDGVVHDTGVVALGGRYKLTRKLALELSQEADVAGDDAMVGPDFTDRMVTNLGLRYELSEDLALGGGAGHPLERRQRHALGPAHAAERHGVRVRRGAPPARRRDGTAGGGDGPWRRAGAGRRWASLRRVPATRRRLGAHEPRRSGAGQALQAGTRRGRLGGLRAQPDLRGLRGHRRAGRGVGRAGGPGVGHRQVRRALRAALGPGRHGGGGCGPYASGPAQRARREAGRGMDGPGHGELHADPEPLHPPGGPRGPGGHGRARLAAPTGPVAHAALALYAARGAAHDRGARGRGDGGQPRRPRWGAQPRRCRGSRGPGLAGRSAAVPVGHRPGQRRGDLRAPLAPPAQREARLQARHDARGRAHGGRQRPVPVGEPAGLPPGGELRPGRRVPPPVVARSRGLCPARARRFGRGGLRHRRLRPGGRGLPLVALQRRPPGRPLAGPERLLRPPLGHVLTGSTGQPQGVQRMGSRHGQSPTWRPTRGRRLAALGRFR